MRRAYCRPSSTEDLVDYSARVCGDFAGFPGADCGGIQLLESGLWHSGGEFWGLGIRGLGIGMGWCRSIQTGKQAIDGVKLTTEVVTTNEFALGDCGFGDHDL